MYPCSYNWQAGQQGGSDVSEAAVCQALSSKKYGVHLLDYYVLKMCQHAAFSGSHHQINTDEMKSSATS